MAGGIIGMNHDDGSRASVQQSFEREKIDLPAMVVDERVTHEPYVLNICQEIEKRIARSGNRNFVAGIAQNAEDERVGFARACSEQHVACRYTGAAVRIIADNRLTGGMQALWFRLV